MLRLCNGTVGLPKRNEQVSILTKIAWGGEATLFAASPLRRSVRGFVVDPEPRERVHEFQILDAERNKKNVQRPTKRHRRRGEEERRTTQPDFDELTFFQPILFPPNVDPEWMQPLASSGQTSSQSLSRASQFSSVLSVSSSSLSRG